MTQELLDKRRLYRIHNGMLTRCYNEYNHNYKNYGALGVIVCEEWLLNFGAFYEWSIANGYRPDLTIDRINPYGNYTPDNCRWATVEQQNRNKRLKYKLTDPKYNIKSLSVAVKEFKIKYIKDAIELLDGNVTKAAMVLKVDRKTLYNSIKKENNSNEKNRNSISEKCRFDNCHVENLSTKNQA